MVESVSDFPFPRLKDDKYLTLEVLMYVDIQEAYNFMFSVNMESRTFLEKNFITLQNGFINEGLVTYFFKERFIDYV